VGVLLFIKSFVHGKFTDRALDLPRGIDDSLLLLYNKQAIVSGSSGICDLT